MLKILSRGWKILKIDKNMALAIIYVIVISIIAIVKNVSSTSPYSPYNINPDGYSNLVYVIDLEIIKKIDSINSKDVVILIPLAREIVIEEFEKLKKLILSGSTIVLLDENGFSNNFLRHIGLDIRVENYKILDEISKYSSREYPVIFTKTGLRLSTYKPSYIVLKNNLDENVFGTTSPYAYADINSDGFYTLGEEINIFAIIYSASIGNGSIWLITDLDILSNRIIDSFNNKEFLKSLSASKKIYLCIDWLDLKPLDILKHIIQGNTINLYNNITISMAMFFILITIYIAIEHYTKSYRYMEQ